MQFTGNNKCKSKKNYRDLRGTRATYSNSTLKTRPHTHTHTPKKTQVKKKKKRTSLSCWSRQARSFGPYRGKDGTPLGCRAPSVVRPASSNAPQTTTNTPSSNSSQTTLVNHPLEPLHLSHPDPRPHAPFRTSDPQHVSSGSRPALLSSIRSPPPGLSLSSFHAPSGRAFALSANRDSRLASCPSTSQGGRSHRSPWRTLSAFKQAASSRPPALLSRAGTRREIAPRLCRGSIPPRGDRVHAVSFVVVCGEGGGVVASSMMLCGVCLRGV